MKKLSKAGGKPAKARRRRASKLKVRIAPKALTRRVAAPARETEVARLTRELSEAKEQQTAAAEVLSVISSSRGKLEPVFNAILRNAARICQAKFGTLNLYDGKHFRTVALHNAPKLFTIRLGETLRPHPEGGLAYVVRTKRVAHIDDLRASPAYIKGDKAVVDFARLGGARTVLIVPMLDSDKLVGTISIYRQEVRPFADKQIELIEYFAAQAVIAIEDARLLTELRESLQEQTATAEVLQVISSSPGDLQPVLDTVCGTAARLCAADMAFMMRREGNVYRAAAEFGFSPVYREFLQTHPIIPNRGSITGRAVLERRAVHVVDVASDPEYTLSEATTLGKVRTQFGVPLLRDGEPIGVICLARQRVEPFTARHIELVSTFADQAVIAIENARLLSELRQRTADLTDALQQQTATADVLKVISRSTFDLESVLNTLTASAAGLCKADKVAIFQKDEDVYRLAAHFGFSPEEEQQAKQYADHRPLEPGRGSLVGRVALESRVVHIKDVLADPDYRANAYQRAFGFRTDLGVPLLREGSVIGVFALMRTKVNAFSEKEIHLVATFADQAVIAIENARLLNELRQRTEEVEKLNQHLEQRVADR